MEKKQQIHFNIWYLIIAVIVVLWLREIWVTARQVQPIPYSEFQQQLKDGRIKEIAISRNTTLEEDAADARDDSIRELARLRADVVEIVRRNARPGRGKRAAAQVDARFAAARFPFRHNRELPRLTVRASAGEVSLDPGFRTQRPWTEAAKRGLIRRGYELTDEELRRDGSAELASAR